MTESFLLPAPALLFCPGNKPQLFEKALARADVIVIDLEDAVGAADKDAARVALIDNPVDPTRVVVRVNAVDAHGHAADLDALAATAYTTVMLAKTESAEQVRGLGKWHVVALCETPLGVLNSPAIAAAENTIALMWGSEDLTAALGGRSSRDDTGALHGVPRHARSTVLLAAKASGRQAIDTVYTDFADLDGLARETAEAAVSGFDLKACIHPSQVAVVVDGFRPTDAQVQWARRIADALDGDGVTSVDGQMIDGPVIRQVEAILRWRAR